MIFISVSAAPLTKGQYVIVKYGKDDWFAGTVTTVSKNGGYTVTFNEGTVVKFPDSRKLKPISKKGKKGQYSDIDANQLIQSYKDTKEKAKVTKPSTTKITVTPKVVTEVKPPKTLVKTKVAPSMTVIPKAPSKLGSPTGKIAKPSKVNALTKLPEAPKAENIKKLPIVSKASISKTVAAFNRTALQVYKWVQNDDDTFKESAEKNLGFLADNLEEFLVSLDLKVFDILPSFNTSGLSLLAEAALDNNTKTSFNIDFEGYEGNATVSVTVGVKSNVFETSLESFDTTLLLSALLWFTKNLDRER